VKSKKVKPSRTSSEKVFGCEGRTAQGISSTNQIEDLGCHLLNLRPPGFSDRKICLSLSFVEIKSFDQLLLCNIRKFVADLRCSIFSVLRQPLTASLHPPPAALRRRDPTSNARRAHNPEEAGNACFRK